jgi:hypothetical protein
MTWTKLGDEYGDQLWELSDAAFRLHTEALIWSNRRHLDGRLDKAEIRRWAKRPEAVDELLKRGTWEDQGEYYQIIHHLGWQRTRAEWLHLSEVNARNRRKGKTRPVRPKDDSSDGSSDGPLDERDWSGLVRTGIDEGTTYVSEVVEKNEEPTLFGPDGQPLCEVCGENPAQGPPAWYPDLCRACADLVAAEERAAYDAESS